MALLIIGNGLNYLPVPLPGIGQPTAVLFDFHTVKTESILEEPILDDNGTDYIGRRVTLEIEGLINRVGIATNRGPLDPRGFAMGDDMPWTMTRLLDILQLPRTPFNYVIKAGEPVLNAPMANVAGGNFPSDFDGGPFVKFARFHKFTGVKLAFLHWCVTTVQSYTQKMLLSNRWDLNQTISDDLFTTRTTTGKTVFRKDFMSVLVPEALADDFRNLVLPICPPEMRRVTVDVTENDIGNELSWTVVDQEVQAGLGGNAEVTEIEGIVTCGVSTPMRTLEDAGRAVAGWGAGLVEAIGGAAKAILTGGIFGAGEIARGIGGMGAPVVANIPRPVAVATVRATGRKNASRTNLFTWALVCAQDRLRPFISPPGIGVGYTTEVTLTTNVNTEGAPYVEVRFSGYGISMNIAGACFRFRPNELLNLGNDYTDDRGRVFMGPGLAATNLPASNNTRGTFLRRMLVQRLRGQTDAYDLPAAPPAPAPAVNYPFTF